MAHPDNTFKALRGEEMFVERWQCRWGFHRWSKWSEPTRPGLYYTQKRTCTDCGRVHIKNVKGNA